MSTQLESFLDFGEGVGRLQRRITFWNEMCACVLGHIHTNSVLCLLHLYYLLCGRICACASVINESLKLLVMALRWQGPVMTSRFSS